MNSLGVGILRVVAWTAFRNSIKESAKLPLEIIMRDQNM